MMAHAEATGAPVSASAERASSRAPDRVDAIFAAHDDPSWQLVADGYEPAIEHEIESLFTVSNGFLGVRGSSEEPAPGARPRTFIAGLYDSSGGDGPAAGVPALVSAPDWLRLRLFVADRPVSFVAAAQRGDLAVCRRALDMRSAVLRSEWRLGEPVCGAVTLRTLRFASLASRALAVQLARIEVDRPCSLSLEAWQEPSAPDLVLDDMSPSLATWHTADGRHRLAAATYTAMRSDRRNVSPIGGPHAGAQFWSWRAAPGRPATFLRLVAFARGDGSADDPSARAAQALDRAKRSGFLHLYDAHARAWARRWAAADVEVVGDEEAQRALRFAAYHLISAANPEDDRVSVGARGLTGDAYLGHVFWDADVYLLPFYCHAWPEAARALLVYRYRTLPAAREKARRLGYRGALYAWESADTGQEATPRRATLPDGSVIAIHSGEAEHHISADVAYAVWQYWRVTGDDGFLLAHGAEILLETARFWASRAGAPEADGRYHIRGVIGPDEYHEGVDDDAYTNAMAAWNLDRGVEVARLLAARWPGRWAALRARLALTEGELAHWGAVAAGLVTGRVEGSPIIQQFDGYFDRAPVELPPSPPLPTADDFARVGATQAVKQPDVVLLLALLPEQYSRAVAEANFRYYEARTAHGSSLSPAIHALVAARLGDVETAARYFHQAATIDLDEDEDAAAAHGVHLGALGGLWMAAVLGFGGLRSAAPDGLRLDPHLPPTWDALRFPLRWRGRACRCEVERLPLRLGVTLAHGEPLPVSVGDLRATLRAGDVWRCEWDEAGQRWKEAQACAHPKP